jgi:hypothetical protein
MERQKLLPVGLRTGQDTEAAYEAKLAALAR